MNLNPNNKNKNTIGIIDHQENKNKPMLMGRMKENQINKYYYHYAYETNENFFSFFSFTQSIQIFCEYLFILLYAYYRIKTRMILACTKNNRENRHQYSNNHKEKKRKVFHIHTIVFVVVVVFI